MRLFLKLCCMCCGKPFFRACSCCCRSCALASQRLHCCSLISATLAGLRWAADCTARLTRGGTPKFKRLGRPVLIASMTNSAGDQGTDTRALPGFPNKGGNFDLRVPRHIAGLVRQFRSFDPYMVFDPHEGTSTKASNLNSGISLNDADLFVRAPEESACNPSCWGSCTHHCKRLYCVRVAREARAFQPVRSEHAGVCLCDHRRVPGQQPQDGRLPPHPRSVQVFKYTSYLELIAQQPRRPRKIGTRHWQPRPERGLDPEGQAPLLGALHPLAAVAGLDQKFL